MITVQIVLELIQCISGLPAFNLKLNRIEKKIPAVFKSMTCWTAPWIWSTGLEQFWSNILIAKPSKRRHQNILQLWLIILFYNWQHNQEDTCVLSYCVYLHAATNLWALNNPASWQITMAWNNGQSVDVANNKFSCQGQLGNVMCRNS